MIELTLFSEPRHRAADPDTSVEAAKTQKSSKELEALIERVVRCGDGLTSEQIVIAVQYTHGTKWLPGTVVSAVSRVKKRGLIVEAGRAKTSRGVNATTYRGVPK